MSNHTQEHEPLLHSVLTGDISEDHASVAPVLASCGHCRDKLEELRAVSEMLDEAGREEEQATFAAIDYSKPVAGADRVESFVRAKLAQKATAPATPPAPQPAIPAAAARTASIDPGRRRFLRVSGVVTAAAASVVLVGWIAKMLLTHEAEDAPDEILLSNSKLTPRSPMGEVDEWTEFHWDYDLPVGATFAITVYEKEPVRSFEPLFEKTGLKQPKWVPTTDELARMPKAISWEVYVLGATGALMESNNGEARLSSSH